MRRCLRDQTTAKTRHLLLHHFIPSLWMVYRAILAPTRPWRHWQAYWKKMTQPAMMYHPKRSTPIRRLEVVGESCVESRPGRHHRDEKHRPSQNHRSQWYYRTKRPKKRRWARLPCLSKCGNYRARTLHKTLRSNMNRNHTTLCAEQVLYVQHYVLLLDTFCGEKADLKCS
jgi:hypothetical protein